MKINAYDYKANELLKFIKQYLNLTQEDFSKEIGISKSSIEKYEPGTVNYPFELLIKIAKIYNSEIIITNKK